MSATPYKPVSWNGEPISNDKLKQMANNEQWLFENAARLRYSVNGLTRDAGIKVIVGKTPYTASSIQHVYLDIYFGSFFSAASRPIVNCTVETTGLGRKDVSITGFGGELDYRGFRAAVYTDEAPVIDSNGWLHWMAVGY